MTKRGLKQSWLQVNEITEDIVDKFLIDIFTMYSKDNLQVPIYTLARELQEVLFLPFVVRLEIVRKVLEC